MQSMLCIIALVRNRVTEYDVELKVEYIPIFRERIIQTQGDGTVAPHWSQGCCSITLSLAYTFFPGYNHTRYGGGMLIVTC